MISKTLDGRVTSHIDSFLRPLCVRPDPVRLAANSGKSFVGLTRRKAPVSSVPSAVPYVNGRTLTGSATQTPTKYMQHDDIHYLYSGSSSLAALLQRARILVASGVSKHVGFTMMPTHLYMSSSVLLFDFEAMAPFGILQSSVHRVWVDMYASDLSGTVSYTVADTFETFPFPPNWEQNATLESRGKAYYEFRAALMVKNDQGLTATYNRFHDPDERDPHILLLRDLHAAMDRAVLDAYGWHDLSPRCAHRDDGRYGWSESYKHVVLDRLWELNAERADQEKTGKIPRCAASATRVE